MITVCKSLTRRPRASHTGTLLALFVLLLTSACQPADPGDTGGSETGPPVASFSQDRTVVGNGGVVQFTSTSTGEVTHHSWDFGSAGTSTDRDPEVQFNTNGTYTVVLEVSGPAGTNRVVENDLITVTNGTTAAFDCEVVVSDGEDPSESLEGIAPLTVRCTDASESATSWSWSFGDGATTTERNPTHTYNEAGTFEIRLDATGALGTDSATTSVVVDVVPVVADFECRLRGDGKDRPSALTGFAPLRIDCEDLSSDATGWAWDFGDGTTTTEQNPSHTYNTDGPFEIRLTATGPGGSDTAPDGAPVRARVGVLVITPTPGSGLGAPVDATFTVDTKGIPYTFVIWEIVGKVSPVPGTQVLQERFRQPGSFTVKAFVTQSFGVPAEASGEVELAYEVIDAPVGLVDFYTCSSGEDCTESDAPVGDSGSVTVQMVDQSEGTITQWAWDFGDGSTCIYYLEPAEGVPSTCDSPSPVHTYAPAPFKLPSERIYDIELTVTGQGATPTEEAVVSTKKLDQARVFLLDPSFEGQSGELIDTPWESLRPVTPTEEANHTTFTGRDVDMPTEGRRWAVLTGVGTDGTEDVAVVENGISQDFIYVDGKPVLEFDFALLYDEPPNGISTDAFVATVSDGATSIEIPNSLVDVTTPLVGESQKFSGRTPPMVVSVLGVGSIDLTGLFPGKPSSEALTLTFRTTNGGSNDLRSPRAYVDNVRFGPKSEDPLTVAFEFDEPILVGERVDFVNTTCGDDTASDPLCTADTSWRWDFDTHGMIATPAPTGSSELDPSYTFPSIGTYTVTLDGFRSDLESSATLGLTVIEGSTADFEYSPNPGPEDPPLTAPETLTFTNTSFSDAGDPIVSWSWDFGGWGTSGLQSPDPVYIATPGAYQMVLTITTASGWTDTHMVLVTLEAE